MAIGAALVAGSEIKAATRMLGYTCRRAAQVNNVLPFDKLIHLRRTETAAAWNEEHDIGKLGTYLNDAVLGAPPVRKYRWRASVSPAGCRQRGNQGEAAQSDERMRNRTFEGASSYKLAPLPGTTSTVHCVCAHRRNFSRSYVQRLTR